MHLFLWAEDSEAELRSELAESFPAAEVAEDHSVLLVTGLNISPGKKLPGLAFCRQLLPDARPATAESIRSWAAVLLDAVIHEVPVNQPWLLQIAPHYSSTSIHRIGARAWHTLNRRGPAHGAKQRAGLQAAQNPGARSVPNSAGLNRCELIREALVEGLQKKRRQLLRQLQPEAPKLSPAQTVVQALLTTPEAGYISVATAPVPFEQRHLISPFPKGEIELASDKAAPSRAFTKLVEAELRLGRMIRAGESCVDLGASPGSWTWVAANRGASVVAVDRARLRDDLMSHPRVRFHQGDAFSFIPSKPVDWLLCDVIAAPEQTADLLLAWVRNRWCKHFVVTLKMRQNTGVMSPPIRPPAVLPESAPSAMTALERLKHELPPLTNELFLARLCANKKEICAFGSL